MTRTAVVGSLLSRVCGAANTLARTKSDPAQIGHALAPAPFGPAIWARLIPTEDDLQRLIDWIDRILSGTESLIIAVLSFAALFIGTAQVILRYIFNMGYTWSEAVFVVLTIAAMLFAGSRGVRDGAHVRVDILAQSLPPKPRKMLRIVGYTVSLALCAFFALGGYLYVRFVHMLGTVSPASELPDWIVYLIVPVTMTAFAVRFLVLIARELRGEDTTPVDPAHGGVEVASMRDPA